MGFNIHHAYGVIAFAPDGYGISANNIEEELFVHAHNRISGSVNIALYRQVRFVSTIIFSKPPVGHKRIAVEKSNIITNVSVIPECCKVTTMCICKLCDKSTADYLVLVRVGCLSCGEFHALNAMNPGFPCNLHIINMAAFAGRNIVHAPGQLFARFVQFIDVRCSLLLDFRSFQAESPQIWSEQTLIG